MFAQRFGGKWTLSLGVLVAAVCNAALPKAIEYGVWSRNSLTGVHRKEINKCVFRRILCVDYIAHSNGSSWRCGLSSSDRIPCRLDSRKGAQCTRIDCIQWWTSKRMSITENRDKPDLSFFFRLEPFYQSTCLDWYSLISHGQLFFIFGVRFRWFGLLHSYDLEMLNSFSLHWIEYVHFIFSRCYVIVIQLHIRSFRKKNVIISKLKLVIWNGTIIYLRHHGNTFWRVCQL